MPRLRKAKAIFNRQVHFITASVEDGSSICGTLVAPTLQNAQSSLVDYNSLELISGYYHSSTEDSLNPSDRTLIQVFSPGGSSFSLSAIKATLAGVRCVRNLTF